jgi:septum site-determining protein MinC
MSSNSVVIKGNRNGITVVLDENMEYAQLKLQIAEKFEASSKFFGNANMALAFEGRRLSPAQQLEVMDIIMSSSDLNIVCIVDDDSTQDEKFQKAIEASKKEEPPAPDSGQFYKGTLRSGQVLEAEGSIIVLGDVNPGGRIIAAGNVIVLGSLRGNVVAGVNGNENCFVVALEMNPMQIKIGEVIARCSDSAPKKKNKVKGVEPKIAYVEEGNIYIEDLEQEVLEDIRIN